MEVVYLKVRYYITASYQDANNGALQRGKSFVTVLQETLNEPLSEKTINEMVLDIERSNPAQPGTVMIDFVYRLRHESEGADVARA